MKITLTTITIIWAALVASLPSTPDAMEACEKTLQYDTCVLILR